MSLIAHTEKEEVKAMTQEAPLHKIPKRRYEFKTNSFIIAEALNFQSQSDVAGRRTLGGFILPDFQRPRVWTLEQNVALIESIYEGFSFGSYAVVANSEVDAPNSTHYYDGILLDGQQRIAAILDYVDNKFPVFGFYYRDITLADQRRFRQTSFPRVELRTTDEALMRDYYNHMNFSGVRHQDDERA